MKIVINRTRRMRLILLLMVGIPSWYFTEMDSTSRFYAYVLPLLTFICVLLFCLWLVDVFAHIEDDSTAE